MTDFKNITSTVHTSEEINGTIIHKVRDSLLAESFLSVITGITILSVMMVVKSYIDIIDVGMYTAFTTLIVPVLHTVIRRIRTDSWFLMFMLHVIISALFFFAAISIPVLGFGNSLPNRFYLAVTLFAMTLASLIYRLRPTYTASDSEFVVFPAIIHVVIYLLYAVAGLKEYAKIIVIHAIIIAVLFIITRQIAVFDTKYYHSIHKTNKPAKLLRKQNNRTILGLIVVISVSLAVLTVIPFDRFTGLLKMCIRSVLEFLSSLIKPSESEYVFDYNDPLEEVEPGDEGVYNPALDVIGYILAVILTITVIFLIINAIRILIMNAPKPGKDDVDNDGNLIDTIEDIRPEKKTLIRKGPDFGTGYERRIRKQFYNKTRRAMKKGLPVNNSSTPGQIENALSADGDNDISALRQEYENVRYGKRDKN